MSKRAPTPKRSRERAILWPVHHAALWRFGKAAVLFVGTFGQARPLGAPNHYPTLFSRSVGLKACTFINTPRGRSRSFLDAGARPARHPEVRGELSGAEGGEGAVSAGGWVSLAVLPCDRCNPRMRGRVLRADLTVSSLLGDGGKTLRRETWSAGELRR
jgi:hypothetical protein